MQHLLLTRTRRALLCLFCLFPLSTIASEQASLGNIRMHMRSTAESDNEKFPIRVVSQTYLFLDQVFKNVYGDSLDRFSLSINSKGIKPDDNGGFVVAVDITGTANFVEGSNILEEDVMSVLKDGFRKYNDLYLEILADSVDPFLSKISYAIVIVDGEDVVDIITPDSSVDQSLEVWAIAAIAAGAGFISILAICLLFIFCLADPEDDEVPEVSKSRSNVSKKSKTTAASSKEEEEEESEIYGKDHLETRSISSQDSSKFTYNPKSIHSSDGFTFASFNTNTQYDVESWQKASTINRSVMAPFGQDISAIENKKDLSHIVEKDEESGSSSHDLSTLRGLHINQEDDQQRRSGGRHSLDLSGAAQDVIEDLNDLSRQVAQYRKSAL
eukprot:scaffold7221_cov165-Amphora_coffeaeformis.AAC.2